MKFDCEYCGKENDKHTGHVNRARRLGRGLYCNRECSGLGRRHGRTEEESKMLKSGYDQMYKQLNPPDTKERAEYHKRTYDPVKAAIIRKKNMPRHVEYCRRPEYRAWKKKYDLKFVAKKNYGEHWESAILLRQISGEIDNRVANQDKGTYNKSQNRKRDYGKLNSITIER